MKKRVLAKITTCLLVLVLVFGLCGSSQAQRNKRNRKDSVPVSNIAEDARPWAGAPWLAGIILMAGAILVGIRNAKRTHLD